MKKKIILKAIFSFFRHCFLYYSFIFYYFSNKVLPAQIDNRVL